MACPAGLSPWWKLTSLGSTKFNAMKGHRIAMYCRIPVMHQIDVEEYLQVPWTCGSSYRTKKKTMSQVPEIVGLMNRSLLHKILANFVFAQKISILLACFQLKMCNSSNSFIISTKNTKGKTTRMWMLLYFMPFVRASPGASQKGVKSKKG